MRGGPATATAKLPTDSEDPANLVYLNSANTRALQQISRTHCKIEFRAEANAWVLVDTSSYGTLVTHHVTQTSSSSSSTNLTNLTKTSRLTDGCVICFGLSGETECGGELGRAETEKVMKNNFRMIFRVL